MTEEERTKIAVRGGSGSAEEEKKRRKFRRCGSCRRRRIRYIWFKKWSLRIIDHNQITVSEAMLFG